MKKRIIYLLLGLWLVSCSRVKVSITNLFPKKSKKDSVLVLELENIKSIKDLDSLICSSKKLNLPYLLPDAYIGLSEIDVPIYEARFSTCGALDVINCYKESTFITIKKDSFYWLGDAFKLNVKNVEKHLTQRFIYPEAMYLSDPRFSVFSIEISEKKQIDKEMLEFQLTTISDSYFNFFYKNISRDSIGYYKKRYPFNLMIERPWNEFFTAAPPPKPESFIAPEP